MRAIVLLLSLAAFTALPAAAGDTCLPTCDVSTAAMRFFVPAASVVQSGSTLAWTSGDNIGHTATDLESFCFHTGFGVTNPGRVLFFIQGETLFAASNGGEAEACTVASLPDGSFILEYLCLAHPEMKGNVVVIP